MTQLMTINDAAKRLSLARCTVYDMVRTGEIGAYKVRGQWRLSEQHLEDYLASRENGIVIPQTQDPRARVLSTRPDGKPAQWV